MRKLLFIHRSVGHHLLEQGRLRDHLGAELQLDDYDNNLGILTRSNGTTTMNSVSMPGNNTNPDNLAAFFQQWPSVLDNYNTVMIKSCYPNSHIKSEEQLEEVKAQYQAIFEAFTTHKKQLIVVTTPPLRPLLTNQREAKLASELADWLVTAGAAAGVQVFDLHHHYAETKGNDVGMLRRDYRRLLPWDTHPNRTAHATTAPQLAEFILSTQTATLD